MKESIPAAGEKVVRRRTSKYLLVPALKKLLSSGRPFTEEEVLADVRPIEITERMKHLGRACRWGGLRREVIAGKIWYFPENADPAKCQEFSCEWRLTCR